MEQWGPTLSTFKFWMLLGLMPEEVFTHMQRSSAYQSLSAGIEDASLLVVMITFTIYWLDSSVLFFVNCSCLIRPLWVRSETYSKVPQTNVECPLSIAPPVRVVNIMVFSSPRSCHDSFPQTQLQQKQPQPQGNRDSYLQLPRIFSCLFPWWREPVQLGAVTVTATPVRQEKSWPWIWGSWWRELS